MSIKNPGNIIVSVLKDTAYFGSILVTIATFISSIFSYFLQFVLGNMLSIEDYGTFNALLSLYSILGIPVTVLTTTLIKISSELKAEERFDKLTALFWRLSQFLLLFGVFISLAIYLLKNYISVNLNISNTQLIAVFGLYVGLSFILVVPVSYLQGLLRFKAYSFFMIAAGLLRLVVPALFLKAGYGLQGVFFGFIADIFIMFLISLALLNKNFRSHMSLDLSSHYKKIFMFGGPVIAINLGMMLMNNIDLILVKKYFDGLSAGYYSGVVTVGKILLFGAGTVGMVMFPLVSTTYAQKGNYKKMFLKTFLLQFLIVISSIAFFVMFPRTITLTLFPDSFINSVAYIPKFSVFMGLYVLINFMILYFIAIEKTIVFVFQIPAVILQFALIYFFHDNLFQVININIIVSLVLFAFLLAYMLKLNMTPAVVRSGKV